METIVKKEFKDLPDKTTPFESEWLNGFQDKIIANFNEIKNKLDSIDTKLAKTLTYTEFSENMKVIHKKERI